jgi:protein gp37
MGATTKIQWTDYTFNPWIGCTKVSPGCKNCYAEKTTRARVLRSQGHETWGKGAQRSRTSAANWKEPLKWTAISDIVSQCELAGVACFVKQLGKHPLTSGDRQNSRLILADKKGGDMAEWPDALRVRQFPEEAA